MGNRKIESDFIQNFKIGLVNAQLALYYCRACYLCFIRCRAQV